MGRLPYGTGPLTTRPAVSSRARKLCTCVGPNELTAMPSGTNGFIRGALRALAGGRRRAGHSPSAPFLLTAWDDGRLTIEDPTTGERIAVSSFGPTQVQSFLALLDTAGRVVSGPVP